MNAKALDLGLTNTHFETPHGLDSNEHYTTAYELAVISNYALNNPDDKTINAHRIDGMLLKNEFESGEDRYKLLLTDPPESMRDNIFEIDGTKYLWMLFEELEVDYDVYAFSNAVAYLKRNSYIEPTGVKGSYRVIKKKSKSVDESTEEFKTLNKELELKEMREKVKKCVRETYLELEKILDEEKPSVYGRNKHTYEDVTTLIEYMRKFDFIVEE